MFRGGSHSNGNMLHMDGEVRSACWGVLKA